MGIDIYNKLDNLRNLFNIKDNETKAYIVNALDNIIYNVLHENISEKNILISANILNFKIFNRYYNFDKDIKTRKPIFVQMRIFLAYFLRYNYNFSYQKIGKFLNKDHATIIFYNRRFERYLQGYHGIDLKNKAQECLKLINTENNKTKKNEK